jgi:hypothetical protein
LDPTQAPFWHESVRVHMSPSEHVAPFVALVGAEHVPVDGLQVPATLQAAAAGQTTGLEPTQAPFWHESVRVHMSPSEHVAPFAALVGVEHMPLAGLQVPATLHVGAWQTIGFAPTQAPFWHESVCVHMSPSEHKLPFAALVGAEHAPELGLQVPATLHAGAVQVMAGPGVHAPAWQLSPTVHGLPSVHVVPFVTGPQVPVAITHIVHAPQTVPLFCQVPVASHICGCAPLQVTSPGLQMPVQVPVLQTFGHAVPVFCHVPVASHVCG